MSKPGKVGSDLSKMPLDNWAAGEELSARKLSQPGRVLRALLGGARAPVRLRGDILQSAGPWSFWVGLIQSSGPDSEADYTDGRYWVQRTTLSVGSTTAEVNTTTITDTTNADYRYITATNLGELGGSDHNLAAGAVVMVAELLGATTTDADIYVIVSGGPARDTTVANTYTYHIPTTASDGYAFTVSGGTLTLTVKYKAVTVTTNADDEVLTVTEAAETTKTATHTGVTC